MDLIALIWDWDILFHHSFWALLYRSPLLVSTLPFSFLKVNYLNNLHLLNLFFSSNTPLFSATTHSLFHSNSTFLSLSSHSLLSFTSFIHFWSLAFANLCSSLAQSLILALRFFHPPYSNVAYLCFQQLIVFYSHIMYFILYMQHHITRS